MQDGIDTAMGTAMNTGGLTTHPESEFGMRIRQPMLPGMPAPLLNPCWPHRGPRP
jgi:hypothetical protein